MTKAIKTQRDVEKLRGELFHMILFAMAWVLIGEYALDFRDYAAGVVITLIVVVTLALYSIKLYDMEDRLSEMEEAAGGPKQMRSDRLYAIILVFEGIAVVLTWSVLLKAGDGDWFIAAFAAIAGLHFFPLARVIGLRSYYALGVWICLLAIAGYLLIKAGNLQDRYVNAIICYGCAAGALVDGIVITRRAKAMVK